MPLPAGTRLGPYEVLAPLGAGGMGEVYRAKDTKLGREVALKILPANFASDPDRLARFEREARVLASLDHPNIGPIYGLEESNGTRALVLALIEGPTLADRITQGPLPVEEAKSIALQIAEAFDYAHDRGVIHRDLKPANIKITPEGVVKVLDFGLAKALEGDDSSQANSNSLGAQSPTMLPTMSMGATQPGMILGTAAYISPEQVKGRRADRRSDIWAFGVVLYEMLTAKRPFDGESLGELFASVVRDEPKLDAIPTEFRSLVLRCLAKDPRQRLQSFGEARQILEGKHPNQSRDREEANSTSTNAPASSRSWLRQVAWVAAAFFGVTTTTLAFLHFRETPSEQKTIRAQIALPENTSNAVTAISPDGRLLAITAEQDGKRKLWIRPLDALVAQPLSGTEGATFPFWSPDSSYIGFFADDKLKKVSVTGGQPITLADAPGNGRGGTWNRDGVIVYAPSGGGTLYQIKDSGGVPERVTKSEGEITGDRFPVFLPDGQHFLYSALRRGLHVGSLDGKSVQVSEENASASFVPSAVSRDRGYLLFVKGRTLVAQPFDATALKTTGDAFPVAEGVGQSGMGTHGDFSISQNRILVYSSGNLQSSSLLAWRDRIGKDIEKLNLTNSVDQATLSADGKTVAVSLTNPASDNTSDLWLMDLSREVPTRLTFHPTQNFAPVWSPNGDSIVYYGGRNRELVLSLLKTNREEVLRRGFQNTHPTDWSRDGKYVVFQEYSEQTRFDLWLLPMTGDRKPVSYLKTKFNEAHAQFSPDGQWMAYDSDESGAAQVYVQSIPPSAATKIQISAGGGTQPRWRRDGRELYYIAADRKLMSVPIKLTSTVEAAKPQPLFGIPAAFTLFIGGRFEYQPSHDGQKFLVTIPAPTRTAQPLSIVVNWHP